MHIPTRIPTIVGVFLVGALVAATATVVNTITVSSISASRSYEPHYVKTTNITDTGFTFTWTTDEPATGAITVQSDRSKKTGTLYDERDTAGKLGTYVTHSVNVRDVTPNTTFFITIISQGRIYKNTDGEYTVRTSIELDKQEVSFDPAFGTITTQDNKPATGAIVYITVDGSQTLSTLVRESGAWLIPLSTIRTEDLSSYLPKKDKYEEEILVRTDGEQTTATTDTQNDSPVPAMVIGKTYDFRNYQSRLPQKTLADIGAIAPKPTTTPPSAVLGTQTTKSSPKSYKVTITQPSHNAVLVSDRPLIQGTGIPNAVVTVTLGIKQLFSGRTTVDESGIWRFSPSKPLAPGKQSVTITTVDRYDRPVAFTHLFEVLKSGTQVLGDATPSGTLTPTPTIDVLVSPTPTTTLVPTPTIDVSYLTPTPTPPVTGRAETTVSLMLLSAILLLTGGAVLLVR